MKNAPPPSPPSDLVVKPKCSCECVQQLHNLSLATILVSPIYIYIFWEFGREHAFHEDQLCPSHHFDLIIAQTHSSPSHQKHVHNKIYVLKTKLRVPSSVINGYEFHFFSSFVCIKSKYMKMEEVSICEIFCPSKMKK